MVPRFVLKIRKVVRASHLRKTRIFSRAISPNRGVAAHGRWCCELQMCVEPTLSSARLGGPLRIRASTRAHHLSPHGVRLVGHHHERTAVFPTYAVAAAAAAAAAAAIDVAAVAAADVVAPAVLAALSARTDSQTSASWLARRTPGPQALPSPTGLCAGAPAGRPPDSVRTSELLCIRAGGLHCNTHAGPCQACSRPSSCALAAGLHLVLRAGMPAPP